MLGLPRRRTGWTWTPFAGRAPCRSYSGAMVDEAAYPVLFGTAQATWAPIDLRFELPNGEVDPARIARVYVVPFVGEACVVVGFEHGDWGQRVAVLNQARASEQPWSGSWPRRPGVGS
jgi:hypothetical protein